MTAADTLDDDDGAPAGIAQYCPTCRGSFPARYERCPHDNDRLISTRGDDPMIGRVLDGRFRIVRPIGRGGMGTVYEALQLPLDRPVAIKVIHEELGGEVETGQRFMREARTLVKLAHPSIVEVFDYGRTDDGTLYLVMELLRGTTLETLVAREERVAPERVAAIGAQICEALAAAHALGIVHRDLKPANVIVNEDLGGIVKVLDFGLAKPFTDGAADSTGKITQIGTMIGTPLYMAPESINSEVIDDRSDLYALGCMLYELLAGEPPFLAAAIHIILARHVHEPAPELPASVPGPLRLLISSLLAKNPADRPASALAVRDTLAAFLSGASDVDDLPTIIQAPLRPSVPTVVDAPLPVAMSAEEAALLESVRRRETIRRLPPPPVAPGRLSEQLPALFHIPPAIRLLMLLFAIAIALFCVVAFLVP